MWKKRTGGPINAESAGIDSHVGRSRGIHNSHIRADAGKTGGPGHITVPDRGHSPHSWRDLPLFAVVGQNACPGNRGALHPGGQFPHGLCKRGVRRSPSVGTSRRQQAEDQADRRNPAKPSGRGVSSDKYHGHVLHGQHGSCRFPAASPRQATRTAGAALLCVPLAGRLRGRQRRILAGLPYRASGSILKYSSMVLVPSSPL